MVQDTIFDKILAKQIPADVVFEDEYVLAIRDINPQAPVHVLVIPKHKWIGVNDLLGANWEDVGHFFIGIAKVANHMKLAEGGYRVVLNSGRDGQQTVEYIHAHILGGRQLAWPPG